DALKMEKRSVPTETEVFDAVLRWKQKRRPPLDEAAVASTIRKLGMLRWLDVKPDAALPVPEEETIPAYTFMNESNGINPYRRWLSRRFAGALGRTRCKYTDRGRQSRVAVTPKDCAA